MLPPPDRLPNLFRHMVVAIYKRQGGSSKSKFLTAVKIARARLVDLKYATPPSREGDLALFSLTSAGEKKNKVHKSDTRWRSKNRLFDELYIKFRSELELEETPKRDQITHSNR